MDDANLTYWRYMLQTYFAHKLFDQRKSAWCGRSRVTNEAVVVFAPPHFSLPVYKKYKISSLFTSLLESTKSTKVVRWHSNLGMVEGEF